MTHRLSHTELIQAQLALVGAIALQAWALSLNRNLLVGPQYVIIGVEVILALLIGLTANWPATRHGNTHKLLATILLALVTMANVASLILVLDSLIVGHIAVSGTELLLSALAIFITNIIVFALWYWEIDSPGLSGIRWSNNDKDFQFIQQNMPKDFPNWRPAFFDYLYVATTNAINFAPSDTKPITHGAKFLMGTQALISIFTLALVIARSVTILGT